MIEQILRPNGTEWGEWSATPSNPNDHENVDEEVVNDSDYLFTSSGLDSFTFPAPSIQEGVIASIRARIRGTRNIWQITSDVGVYLNSVPYVPPGPPYPAASGTAVGLPPFVYEDFDVDLPLSHTGNKWTWEEVATLRMGMRGETGSPRVSQVYLTIISHPVPLIINPDEIRKAIFRRLDGDATLELPDHLGGSGRVVSQRKAPPGVQGGRRLHIEILRVTPDRYAGSARALIQLRATVQNRPEGPAPGDEASLGLILKRAGELCTGGGVFSASGYRFLDSSVSFTSRVLVDPQKPQESYAVMRVPLRVLRL